MRRQHLYAAGALRCEIMDIICDNIYCATLRAMTPLKLVILGLKNAISTPKRTVCHFSTRRLRAMTPLFESLIRRISNFGQAFVKHPRPSNRGCIARNLLTFGR